MPSTWWTMCSTFLAVLQPGKEYPGNAWSCRLVSADVASDDPYDAGNYQRVKIRCQPASPSSCLCMRRCSQSDTLSGQSCASQTRNWRQTFRYTHCVLMPDDFKQ